MSNIYLNTEQQSMPPTDYQYDIIVKYSQQYLLYAQEQPEFNMVEFELLRNEIEKTLM